MSRLSTLKHKTKITIWTQNGVDNEGKVRVKSPLQYLAGWNDTEDVIDDADGRSLRIVAKVSVNSSVPQGSIIAKVALASSGSFSGDYYRVAKIEVVPLMRGINSRKILMLERYNKTLPEIYND